MPTKTNSVSATAPKVLLIRNAFAYDFGGGERFPVDLAAELRKLGFAPTVVSRSPQLLAYADAHGIPRIRGWWWSRQNWSGARAVLFPLYLLWQLALTAWYLQLLRKLNPDIVHPQSKDDFIAASRAAKLLGKRIIWTDHADLKYVYQNHRIWYKNPVGKLVFRASRLADAVTLVSRSEARLVAKALGQTLPAHYQVVHNGVTDTAVIPLSRSSAEAGSFIFCATSRLVEAKGIGELLGAFKTLHAKHAGTALWLVGDGPDAQRFKAQAAALEGITFLGHQDKPLAYVAAADVFVHPSHHEGFSLSLLEAAMLARPIVTCDVGGNPEIVHNEQTGLLVPPRDSIALAAAMQRLYDDRQLAAKLARGARKLYEQDFQFDRIVAQQFVPLYTAKAGDRP